MKKLIFILLFPFLLLVNLNSQEIVEKSKSDSVIKFEVKFQNPKLFIDDQRNVDLFTQLLQEDFIMNKNLERVLGETNRSLNKYTKVLEKEQDESFVSYLSKKAEKSEKEIRSILSNYAKAKSMTYYFTGFILLLILISYFLEHRKYERDWRHSIIKGFCLFILLCILYKLTSIITLYVVSPGYIELKQLIELTT